MKTNEKIYIFGRSCIVFGLFIILKKEFKISFSMQSAFNALVSKSLINFIDSALTLSFKNIYQNTKHKKNQENKKYLQRNQMRKERCLLFLGYLVTKFAARPSN